MAETLVIDVVDISVPAMRAINIAIINQPNPVSGFAATYDQLAYLINFPKYRITESATGKVVNGESIYKYFPDKDPSGGGGGDVPTVEANGFVVGTMALGALGPSLQDSIVAPMEFLTISE